MHPMLRTTLQSLAIAVVFSIGLPAILLLVPLRFPGFATKIRMCLLVLCLVAICSLTILREPSGIQQLSLMPFASYRNWTRSDVRWQICMNIAFFIPYGALLQSLNIKHPILCAFLTSILIELIQYFFALGLCETDDVINNTLGAAIGCSLFVFSDTVLRKHVWDMFSRDENDRSPRF